MSARRPHLALLLRGDGNVLALSPLTYDDIRDRMLEALHDRLPRYTQRDHADPGIALIEAFAACVEVMGFYHDRILTESKLGSAILLRSIARLAAIVGYIPTPPLAAEAFQFFEAAADGRLLPGTKVGGRALDPPVNAVFETLAALAVSPVFNQMALSPLITRYAGARRVVLQRPAVGDPGREAGLTERGRVVAKTIKEAADQQTELATALPLDDFRIGMLAMINGLLGLELCPIESSRQGGVAFSRPLLRSYDDRSAVVSRATQIRHLRFPCPLGGDDAEQVVFEVTDRPILHLPDAAALESLSSTLEVFVFEGTDEIGAPETWDPAAAWKEVRDFSASLTSDRHYRTFVDDRLTTYIVLRRKLGYRELLSEDDLTRVYARFTPAIGRAPVGDDGEPMTLALDASYFDETSIVRPTVKGRTIINAATWAVTAEEMGLRTDDQIAIQGGSSGNTFIRTLSSVSGRKLRWKEAPKEVVAAERAVSDAPREKTCHWARQGRAGVRQIIPQKDPPPRPFDEHAPIKDTFDPTKATIAPLTEVAWGQQYLLWEEFYKQASEPDDFEAVMERASQKADDSSKKQSNPIPLSTFQFPWREPDADTPSNALDRLRQGIFLHKGTNFLLLDNSSHVKSGDYLLIGRWLRAEFRNSIPEPLPAGEEPKGRFDSHAPWLTAEVVQVIEVHGNLVRLKDPVGQDFHSDWLPLSDLSEQDREKAQSHWKDNPDSESFVTFEDDDGHVEVRALDLTQVVIIPNVAWVYYGDTFAQTVELDDKGTFIENVDLDTYYVRVELTKTIDAPTLREALEWQSLTPNKMWDQLFLAVSGYAEDVEKTWSFSVDVDDRGITSEQLLGLSLLSGEAIADPPGAKLDDGKIRFKFKSPDAANLARAHLGEIGAEVKPDAIGWSLSASGPVAPFRVIAEAGWFFLPSIGSPDLDEALLAPAGTLLLRKPGGASEPFAHHGFTYSQHDQGLRLTLDKDSSPAITDPNEVIAASTQATIGAAAEGVSWSADWLIKGVGFDSTDWRTEVTSFRAALLTTDDERAYPCRVVDDDFELLAVPIKADQPLDPLAGVTEIRAEIEDKFVLGKDACTALWRLALSSDDLDALGSESYFQVALRWDGAASLMLGVIDAGADSDRLTFKDTKGDVPEQVTEVQALDSTGASPGTTNAWALSVKGSDFDPKAPKTGVARARPWAASLDGATIVLPSASSFWDDKTLYLFNAPTLGPGKSVNPLVEYYDGGAITNKEWSGEFDAESAATTTTITFTPTFSWPDDDDPASFIVAVIEEESAEPQYEVRAVLSGVARPEADTEMSLTFEGKVGESWSKFYFVSRAIAADTAVTEVGGLVVSEPDWRDSLEKGKVEFQFTKGEGQDFALKAKVSAVALSTTTDGEFFCLPDGEASFPAAEEYDKVWLSLRTWPASGETGVTLSGSTLFNVPIDEAVSDTLLPLIHYVSTGVIQGAPLIKAQRVSETTLELAVAYPKLFPSSVSSYPNARLIYASAVIEFGQAPVRAAQRVHLILDGPPATDTFAKATNADAVVFHDATFDKAIVAPRIEPFPDLDDTLKRWTVNLQIDPATVFIGADSTARLPDISFAQRWTDLLGEVITWSPLQIKVGAVPGSEAFELDVGDQLKIDDAAAPSTVTKTDSRGVYLDTTQTPISTLKLLKVSLSVSADDLSADLTITTTPKSVAPPWLMTFDRTQSVTDGLLRYTTHDSPEPGRERFTFKGGDVNRLIENAGNALFVYTNQRAELVDKLYLTSDVPVPREENLLVAEGEVGVLLAQTKSTVFPAKPANATSTPQPHPHVLICSTLKLPPKDTDSILGRHTNERLRQQVMAKAVSQSIVFNSGNFIPILGLNNTSEATIVKNALRVSMVINGKPKITEYREDLSEKVAEIERHAYKVTEDFDGYSFTKAPGGVFILNFLSVQRGTSPPTQAIVQVKYGAARLNDPADHTGRIYVFEIPVRAWSSRSQLVVLDAGEITPKDLLFLHNTTEKAALIQWTQVERVAGPIITVKPELTLAKSETATYHPADFQRFMLCGFKRPNKPVKVDAEYYARAAKQKFEPNPDAPDELPELKLFPGDRLSLRPESRALLDALIPGDHIIVWDEQYREAWRKHRKGELSDGSEWSEWPDHHYEAVIKAIDPASGLVVLTEPLPDGFAVGYTWDSAATPASGEPEGSGAPAANKDPTAGTLTPHVPDIRVLPHYRAPFQGERTMIVLGSSDPAHRFPRYLGRVDADVGLATIPLATATDGIYYSNIEVLARDPRSGEWSRWVQFDRIDRATKKDRAFTLGTDASAAGDAAEAAANDACTANLSVPFSVSFGDGQKQGQLPPNGNGIDNIFARPAKVGLWSEHMPKPRKVQILSKHRQDLWPFPAPCTGAKKRNLQLTLEYGVPERWSPLTGQTPWRSTLVIETSIGPFREISEKEAKEGYDGFHVRKVRPGVVEVFFFSRELVPADKLVASEVPEARPWMLDRAFYQAMTEIDPTREVGAKRMQLRETTGLRKGSLLALCKKDEKKAETSSIEIAVIDKVDPNTWSATFKDPLKGVYELDSSFVQGNLVEVAQGATESFTIGSGDGSTLNLRLPIYTKEPLIYHRPASGADPEPGVTVLVDKVPWKRVLDLEGSGPRDRVFRLDVDPDGNTFVVFGDGTHGAVPHWGIDNITVAIRTGDGAAGNLPIGAVNKLLDGNLAVKKTRNLTPATGGRAGAGVDETRERLLERNVGFDRVVSVDDVIRVALEVGEVLHAKLDPTAPARSLTLVVALRGRRALDEKIRKDIEADIAGQMPATAFVKFEVVRAQQVPVHLVIEDISVSGYDPADVLAALQDAFSAGTGRFFGAERWPIGEPLRLGDVYEAIFAVPGVTAAHVSWMSTQRPPYPLPKAADEIINPGPRGMIRCDNDALSDPYFQRGSITFELGEGAQ